MSVIRKHKGSVVWSLMLHIAVVAAVIVGLPWRIERPRVPVAATVIEGVIIDRAAIEREQTKREEAARAERQRQVREERQRQQAAEEQQREQQRVASEQRAREEAERKEEERVAAERAAQRRREEQAKAEAEAQAKREREEAERRAQQLAEQRRRQQAEAELAQQIAREAEANAARAAGELDEYLLMLENKIRQKWNRPLSARVGLDCWVTVAQAPTGDVLSARVDPARCNGDEAVRRSIERAVMDASPLPKPRNPALFERNLNVNFRPEE